MKITPGTVIRDNDPRMPGRELKVSSVGNYHAYCLNSIGRKTVVNFDRIHTDGKPRKSGFSVVTWGKQE